MRAEAETEASLWAASLEQLSITTVCSSFLVALGVIHDEAATEIFFSAIEKSLNNLNLFWKSLYHSTGFSQLTINKELHIGSENTKHTQNIKFYLYLHDTARRLTPEVRSQPACRLSSSVFTCGAVLGCSSWLWSWRAAWSSSSARQCWRSPWVAWRAELETLAWLWRHTQRWVSMMYMCVCVWWIKGWTYGLSVCGGCCDCSVCWQIKPVVENEIIGIWLDANVSLFVYT